MANLLPLNTQRRLFLRTLVRMSLVGGLLLVLVSVIGMFALLPGYFVLRTQKEAIAYDLARLTGGTTAQTDRDALTATNKRLQTFLGFRTERHFSDAFRAAIESRPSGMTIRRLAYESGASAGTSTMATLTISGVFRNRDDQSVYLARLRSNPLFSSVEIPISALILTDQGAVTFTARGNF